MASNWLANLQEILSDSGTYTARITWHNDVEGKKSAQDVPLVGIKDLPAFNSVLRNTRNNKLDTSIELVKILSSEIGTDLNIESAPVPDPTPGEIAKQEYFNQRSKLTRMKSDVDLGIISSGDKIYTEQLALVISLYKVEYYS